MRLVSSPATAVDDGAGLTVLGSPVFAGALAGVGLHPTTAESTAHLRHFAITIT